MTTPYRPVRWRWLRRRHELITELTLLERHARDLASSQERMLATARVKAGEHETSLREIDRLRSEIAARDVADAVDELGLEDLGGHRHCVPMSEHVALINRLDQMTTRSRTGGAP